MNEKVYHIKDLNELRFSNASYLDDDKQMNYSLSKGKSIFALGNDKIEPIYPKRVQSKKLPKLSYRFNTSKNKIKETSVPLFIGKEQGTIASYLPFIKSPDSVKNSTKNHHYLKKNLNLDPLDISSITAVGYKLKYNDNEIKK